MSDEVLVWLSVWSEVQIVCVWSGWCHCHPKTPSYLASNKSRLVLPIWYQLTRLTWEKRPLNRCSSSSYIVHNTTVKSVKVIPMLVSFYLHGLNFTTSQLHTELPDSYFWFCSDVAKSKPPRHYKYKHNKISKWRWLNRTRKCGPLRIVRSSFAIEFLLMCSANSSEISFTRSMLSQLTGLIFWQSSSASCACICHKKITTMFYFTSALRPHHSGHFFVKTDQLSRVCFFVAMQVHAHFLAQAVFHEVNWC